MMTRCGKLASVMTAMLISLCACVSDSRQPIAFSPSVSSPSAEISSTLPDASQTPGEPIIASGKVIITFDFAKQSGYASNQFAVWIEDSDGTFIKTLYATRFTAAGGYQNRPDSIPSWVEKSGLASMSKDEVDAITGATPKAGTLAYTWDLTDANGDAVHPGEYSFFVEGSLRWKNRVLYSGVIEIDDAPTTAETSAKYIYEASDDQPALTNDASENTMLNAVSARFAPTGD